MNIVDTNCIYFLCVVLWYNVHMKKFWNWVVLYLAYFLIMLTIYIRMSFDRIVAVQLIMALNHVGGASPGGVTQGAIFVVGISVLLFVITFIIVNILKKNKKIKDTSFIVRTPKYILIISIFLALLSMGFIKYGINCLINGDIFEKEYVDPRDVTIEFHDRKKNLIFIYSESLEMSGMSTKNGGNYKDSIMPNMEKIALDNLNFSDTEKLGGAKYNEGSSWTAAAMISTTSGVPFQIPLGTNIFNEKLNRLDGVYSLGDVLEDNGYSNYLLMGSKSSFAGRDLYYKEHGHYLIQDYDYAVDKKYIPEGYWQWWGIEDSKLLDIAKRELTNLDKSKPFNYTILTSDTHFIDGYVEKDCPNKFDSQYLNSFYCEDMILSEFIYWLQKQDFYKDTTIVVVGDHLTMQSGVFKGKRTIYNTFINSETTDNNKNRTFLNMDIYPTTLGAMGVSIEGDRLGLGTNMYSSKKTLSEEYGYKKYNREISKNSKFYKKKILNNK